MTQNRSISRKAGAMFSVGIYSHFYEGGAHGACKEKFKQR